MGLWDVEEELDDFFEDDLEDANIEVKGNKYLENSEEAVKLISKIISLKQGADTFTKQNKKIENILNTDLLSTFKQIQLDNEAKLQMKLELLSEKLVEQNKFEILKNKSIVGIGGKFSAGKSKFINSILKAGEELLPEAQNPTTSIPTYIVKGDKEIINAYTKYNEKVRLNVEELQALTHKFYEKYKMGFSYFINSLIISEPDMPYEEIAFLDTPGYSKADSKGEGKNQKELTDENKAYTQLRNVDYLIWLMDIENGVLSESDIRFIKKLELETPILIVINKADKKIDAEIEKIVKIVNKTAENAGIQVFDVVAYSSWDGKEWRSKNSIQKFLNYTMIKKKEKKDILEQIEEVKEFLLKDLNKKIDNKIQERNNLGNIIFNSDDIKEIKILADMYGESLEEIRKMKSCRRQYKYNKTKLEKLLESYNRR